MTSFLTRARSVLERLFGDQLGTLTTLDTPKAEKHIFTITVAAKADDKESCAEFLNMTKRGARIVVTEGESQFFDAVAVAHERGEV